MLATLLESRHRPARRPGSAFASVALHAGLMTLAVVATARATFQPDRPAEHALPFVQTPAPAAPPVAARAASSAPPDAAPALVAPAAELDAPIDVPDVIPAIDITHRVTDPSAYTGSRPSGVGSERVVGGGLGLADSAVVSNRLVDKAAFMLPGQRPPEYPNPLRRAGVEGTVEMQFVLDTTGRIDATTAKVLSSPHELFTQAVRASLARMRYAPAESHGRRVRVLVQQAFVFSIEH
jgi:periplasmic protein TonB